MIRLLALVIVLFAWAMPVSAFTPMLCHVLEDDGSISQFFPGFPQAELADETDDYGHGVLGDAIEYRTIRLVTHEELRLAASDLDARPLRPRTSFSITLPNDRVFEDVEVRVLSPTARSWRFEGANPIPPADRFVVVETEIASGASLSLYLITCNGIEKIAATPPIGTAYRWLAPAGIEDFDGDGRTDIAYVETPHLAGILKIVTRQGDELVPIVTPMPGFSNHAIGEDFITSGVRLCRKRAEPIHLHNGMFQAVHPELLVPSRDRTVLHAVRIENGALVVEDRPEPPTPEGIRAAQTCSPEESAQ